MPELILDLTGLCAFVPKTTSINMANNQVRVLMVDARAPHGGHNHEPHHPVLVFDHRLDGSNQRVPDLRFFEESREMGLCFLNDIELSITGANTDKLMIVDNAGAGVDCPNSNGEEDLFFSWVLRMENAHTGSGTVQNDCLADRKVPRSVAARARLTQGTLQVRRLALDTAASPVELLHWRCGPVGGRLERRQQAIAEEVEYRYQFGGTYLEIAMTSLSRRQQDAPAALTPLRLAPDSDQQVHAAILNMPLDDILGRRAQPARRPPRGPDLHFEHFYAFSSYDPGHRQRPVPHPVGSCPRDSDPDVANPKCPPVQFAPHGAA